MTALSQGGACGTHGVGTENDGSPYGEQPGEKIRTKMMKEEWKDELLTGMAAGNEVR